MNQTHVHLLINHLPIIGSILGAFVLAQGLWTRNNQTKIAAYSVFIISSIGAGIAYLTGEAAEETVENIKGISENMIDQHKNSSLIALIALIILGLVSIIAVFLTLRNALLTRTIAWITLFISMISFGLVARSGYLGGKIRHTEINSAATTSGQNEKEQDED